MPAVQARRPERTFLNISGFARLLGVHPEGLSKRKLPDPDVVVGQVICDCVPYVGWSVVRAREYQQFILNHFGRNKDGTISLRPRIRLEDVNLPAWWDVPIPEFFLNITETAKLLHLERMALTMRIRRGTFPVAPAVRIGADTYGWDELEVRAFGIREGYIWPDGSLRVDTRRVGAKRKAELQMVRSSPKERRRLSQAA